MITPSQYFASPSNWERYTWGPVSVVLAVLFLLVAQDTDGRGKGA